jgi:TolA-binding protein
MSSVLIQGLKVRFNENDFKSVVKEAERLVAKYPTSPYVVESHFFMAEAYFKMQKFEKVADVVEIMGEHYPDHILTGFILLRLGQIYEMNNKVDEAQEVYRVIQKEFKQAEIQNQVSRLIKD